MIKQLKVKEGFLLLSIQRHLSGYTVLAQKDGLLELSARLINKMLSRRTLLAARLDSRLAGYFRQIPSTRPAPALL